MTWAGLVGNNLMRRPVRTGLTILGLAISVGLIVALLSITSGVTRTADDIVHVGRSDFGLFQANVSDLTRSLLPASLSGRVAAAPGVAATSRVFVHVTTVGGHESVVVFGLERDEFVVRRLVITDGRRAVGAEAMVGDGAVDLLGLGAGGSVTIGGRSFRVAGVFHSGNRFVDNGVVLPLASVQRLAGRPGEITSLGVQVAASQRPADVARALERRFPGMTAVTEPGQVVKIDTSSRLIVSAAWALSALALIVGGISVTNTMAMSVFERTHEIGVLRAIGWSRRRVAALILAETLAIGLLALAGGLLLGWLAARLFTGRSQLATLVEPDMTAGVFAWGLAFALGVALVGACYPTWLAVTLRPIRALRYE